MANATVTGAVSPSGTAAGDQELDGAGVAVVDRSGEVDGVGQEPISDLGVEARGRSQLHHLLESALDRAVPLEQVDDVAGAVGQDLGLDVADVGHGLLEEDGRVPEGRLPLPAGHVDRLDQIVGVVDPAEPPPSPAGCGLDEDGEPDVGRETDGVGRPLDRRGLLQHRQPGGIGRGPGPHLVAGQLQHRGPGADEGQAGRIAGLGQIRALGQEAVAGIDGIGPGLEGGVDDQFMIEVGPDRMAPLPDLIGLVGLDPVQRPPVLPGVDGHRPDAELGGGPERSDGDLAPVGNQDLLHGRHSDSRTRRHPMWWHPPECHAGGRSDDAATPGWRRRRPGRRSWPPASPAGPSDRRRRPPWFPGSRCRPCRRSRRDRPPRRRLGQHRTPHR